MPGGGGAPAVRWPAERANEWAARTGWLVGCNYIPSTAINALEMWQADTFNPSTIDRELGWAQDLGFNAVRVFLHNLLWQQNPRGFLDRMDAFLNLAARHHIRVAFVLFDSCWDPNPRLGGQPAPRPYVHNSGWVQAPGREFTAHPERLDELKPYVQGVIGRFHGDSRIAFWDVFNEPDNGNESYYAKEEPPGKATASLQLLTKVFAWAREMIPSQPLTSGVWRGTWANPAMLSEFEWIQLEQSDIVTFHNYGEIDLVGACIRHLRRYGRPVICTEFMARPRGSTFDPILGFFEKQGVGAFNWGFVSGKTQTIYPWDSWSNAYKGEPALWFHDIFRENGRPYDSGEVRYIRSVTSASASLINPHPSQNR